MAFQALSAILSWPTFLSASRLLKRRHIFGGISYHAVSNTDFSQSSDGATIENSRAAKPDGEESERAGIFASFKQAVWELRSILSLPGS